MSSKISGMREGWIVVAGLVIALAVRLLLIWELDNFQNPVSWEYGEIARHLVTDGEYAIWGLRSWMPPLYPALIAAVMYLFPEPFLALEIFQAIFSTFSGLLLYWLAKELFDEDAGRVALLGFALYPPLAVKVGYVDPITVEMALLCAAFLLLARARSKGNFLDTAGAGLLLGLTVLSRPVLLAAAPVIAATGVWAKTGKKGHGALFMGAFCLAVLPWTVRNYAHHGEIVLVSSNGGFNFWIGNSPLATGEVYAEDGEAIGTKMPIELQKRLEGKSEVERDQIFYREGAGWIAREPVQFARLCLQRAAYFWGFRPQVGKGTNGQMPTSWVIGYKVLYGFLLLLAVIGTGLARRRWRDLLPFWALFAALTSVYALFFVHTRYRMIIEPLLIAFASYAVVEIVRRLRGIEATTETS